MVIKRPMALLLPDLVRTRLGNIALMTPAVSPGALAKVSIAIVLGASTHLLWDSFTHEGRWGTRRFPSLESTWLTVANHSIPGFKVLQYGSTLVCLPALVTGVGIWLARRAPSPDLVEDFDARIRRLAWIVAISIPALVTLCVMIEAKGTLHEQLGQAITTSGLILMFSLLCYSFAMRPGKKNW
jgi:hypothetical protein